MKLAIHTIAILFIAANLIAQLGDRFYGTGVFKCMQSASDGNYYTVGSKNGNQLWLLKMDASHNIIWEKTFKGPNNENAYANYLLVNADGSLLIVGSIVLSMYGDLQSFAIKTDANGMIQWSHTYMEANEFFHACPKQSGGYYLGGHSDPPGAANNGCVLEIDKNGNLILSFKVNVYNRNNVNFIAVNTDGSLTLIGRTSVIGAGFQGIFISKRGKDGSEISRNIYDSGDYNSSFDPHPLAVIKRANGNYLVAPSYQEVDCILLEFDPDLNILSHKIYGDGAHNENPWGLIELKNGDLVIVGASLDNLNGNSQSDAFAIRLNANGYELWRKYYTHHINDASLFGAEELSNHDLFFYGMAKNNQAWILTTDQQGVNTDLTITGKVIYDTNNNCNIDPGEPPLKSVLIKNQGVVPEYAATDANGNFSFHADTLSNSLTAFPPDEYSTICNNVKVIQIDSITKTAYVEFLVKPLADCDFLRVELTQPDLVKCNESRYQVYVKNTGGTVSKQQQLKIQLDPQLNLIRYTSGGQVNQNQLSYSIPPIQSQKELIYEFVAQLSCNAFPGAAHLVTAEVLPASCEAQWTGPQLEIKSECIGDHVRFHIQNTGKNDMAKDADYRIFADQYLIDQQAIRLNANQTIDLDFETKGMTFHADIDDVNSILPPDKYVYSFVEGCGTNHNGIFSTGYENAFRNYNPDGHKSISLAANTTGVPDRVKEMIDGLGYYYLITDNGWMEYTVRTRNPTLKEVSQVEIQLSLTDNLDLSTFEILGNSENITLAPLDSLNLKVTIDNLHLLTDPSGVDADLYFKFKIKPFANTPSDSSRRSFLSVSANVYFDKMGPYPLSISRNNLSQTIPYIEKPDEKYADDISLFGGRYDDFGTNIAHAQDGSVFLLIQTNSYDDGIQDNNLVIKLDKDSKVIWYKIVAQKPNYSIYADKIIALKDGGCMILGSGIASDKQGALGDYEAVISRLNLNGDTVFTKYYHPGLNQRGGNAHDLIESKDGNYIFCGLCSNGDNFEEDNYLIKIDSDGNIIWAQDYIIDGLAFEAINLFELANGDLLSAGDDEGRNLLIAQRTDALGNKLWIKTVTPQLIYQVSSPSAVVTKDEEIAFLMYDEWQDPNSGNIVLTPHFTKLTKSGNYLLEKKPIVGIAGYAFPSRLLIDKDGNYFVLGEVISDTVTYNEDAMLAKFDPNFNLLWFKQWGSSNLEQFFDGAIADNNTIHMIGYNQPRPPDYNLQAMYVKTDLNIVANKDLNSKTHDAFLIFPNPAQDKFTVFFFDPHISTGLQWELMDINARCIKNGILQSNKLTIDVHEIPQGIYALRFSKRNLPIQKIIINH